MLIRFRVSNFRSLRDEQELSLVASFRGGRNDTVRVDSLDLELLRVAGIYGANAAGKSNVLEALRFMRDAVRGSHRAWPPEGPIPREPFLFDSEMQSAPSHFEVSILVEDVHYQYGFRLDDQKVLEEWLLAFPRARRQVWFHRTGDEFKFGKHLKGSNRILQKLTRGNSLFLSVSASNNHEALFPIYSWFAERLRVSSHANRPRQLSCTVGLLGGDNRDSVVGFLRQADLGIMDVRLAGQGSESAVANPLEFHHSAKAGMVTLPLEKESHGTQALLLLSGPILDALENRSLLCIDELDASLHPHLASEVIRMFQDPKRNPKNAQLIFNTHDTTLLTVSDDEPVLHRDQIWFVEKDDEGASHLYPLTDFKPRKFENLERGYLQGRYGAVPFIDLAPMEDHE